MTDVVFPPLSSERPDATGVLSRWYARDGEHVDESQALAEVMVDKVAADVLAPTTGTLHVLVAEDSEVVQGTVIGSIER
jgi:pyruvate/2-oxoglutarate dehydrogenase complex dihydrolipoamide acyltransferase (E2) component